MQAQVELEMTDIKKESRKKKTAKAIDPEERTQKVIDQKDLAALWAIGILVSLLLSLAGSFWNPPRYEARQSTAVDETEARVENTQNQLVADALNQGGTIYDDTMEKLVKPRPAFLDLMITVAQLLLFPCGPIIIVGRLLIVSLRRSN